MPGNEQNKTRAHVGNPTAIWGQKAQYEKKKVLLENNFQFDPDLVAAILKRSPDGIKTCLTPTKAHGTRESLTEDQHEIFKGIYEEVYFHPIKLAMKVCDSETLETTQANDPTRFDVLHCLAANWDHLIESARQKGHTVPDLGDVLDYARDLKSHIPLHTFILGLSDERKEEAANILNAKVAAAAPAA